MTDIDFELNRGALQKHALEEEQRRPRNPHFAQALGYEGRGSCDPAGYYWLLGGSPLLIYFV